eukprot:7364096-Prymnesium_polylepis.1
MRDVRTQARRMTPGYSTRGGKRTGLGREGRKEGGTGRTGVGSDGKNDHQTQPAGPGGVRACAGSGLGRLSGAGRAA